MHWWSGCTERMCLMRAHDGLGDTMASDAVTRINSAVTSFSSVIIFMPKVIWNEPVYSARDYVIVISSNLKNNEKCTAFIARFLGGLIV